MNSNISRNQTHFEEEHEFFGGEMQPYIDDLTKNYEQKYSTAYSAVGSTPRSKKMIKISFWRKFAAFFSFL